MLLDDRYVDLRSTDTEDSRRNNALYAEIAASDAQHQPRRQYCLYENSRPL